MWRSRPGFQREQNSVTEGSGLHCCEACSYASQFAVIPTTHNGAFLFLALRVLFMCPSCLLLMIPLCWRQPSAWSA